MILLSRNKKEKFKNVGTSKKVEKIMKMGFPEFPEKVHNLDKILVEQ